MIGFILITGLFLRSGEIPGWLPLKRIQQVKFIYLLVQFFQVKGFLCVAQAILKLFLGVASNSRTGLPRLPKCQIKGVHSHAQLQLGKYKLQNLKQYL